MKKLLVSNGWKQVIDLLPIPLLILPFTVSWINDFLGFILIILAIVVFFSRFFLTTKEEKKEKIKASKLAMPFEYNLLRVIGFILWLHCFYFLLVRFLDVPNIYPIDRIIGPLLIATGGLGGVCFNKAEKILKHQEYLLKFKR
tara:strand:+ start:59 stop:487 length:429 start_codon:yes stop_codon:yes gene_type:complete